MGFDAVEKKSSVDELKRNILRMTLLGALSVQK